MEGVQFFLQQAVNFIWGIPLLVLLIGGGLFFLIYSRFLPFRHVLHGVNVLRGKYDNSDDKGVISHFQALSGALAATVGVGNISGVALAIVAGGPGAIFWMWVCALLGMATNFFTCTLSVLYRSKDTLGRIAGGPMYTIREGMGKKWLPLAWMFCIAGCIGATPVFQTQQMVTIFKETIILPMGVEDSLYFNLMIGLVIATLVGVVILGGVKRIGIVASRLVPSMVLLYGGSVLLILGLNYSEIIPSLQLIFEDAFSAKAVLGGSVGAVILEGAKRAAFSNEAGIGTSPMMYAVAKTKEPVREGMVAMLGPAIDTLLVCTLTGLCIIITGTWKSGGGDGILLTSMAFEQHLPYGGVYILVLAVMVFGITTIFGLAFYGRQCLSFLLGAKYGHLFNYSYILLIVVGSVAKLDLVVNLVFVGFGLMAFPTMISAVVLAPKVKQATRDYFKSA